MGTSLLSLSQKHWFHSHCCYLVSYEFLQIKAEMITREKYVLMQRLIFHIIVQFLAVNVIPVLMILNNEKITIYAKTKFMCNTNVNNNLPI